MIVVDTNIIAYLWIPGSHTSQVEGVLQKDRDWAAPLLWRSEFRNVLAGYLRRKQIELNIALQIMDEAERQLSGKEYSISSINVLTLVNKSGCSAYDCEFVALAKDLGVPLVTTDKKILSGFPTIAITAEQFVAT